MTGSPGRGYYRNAYDFASARTLLPGPAGPGGTGEVVLRAHDPLTGEDHQDTKVSAPAGAVLIVDSAFTFRPEYNDYWEYRIWLEVDATAIMRPRRSTWPRSARRRSQSL